MRNLTYAIREQALLIDPNECGDLGFARMDNGVYTIALIDVLGHGKEARKVALLSKFFLEEHYQEPINEIINGLHKHIYGSRGLVIGLIRIDCHIEKMWYTGIGNIELKVFGLHERTLLLHDGVVGFGEISPKMVETDFQYGDALILHSDGVTGHFEMRDINYFLRQDVDIIADKIMKQYATKYDDASCVIVKYAG